MADRESPVIVNSWGVLRQFTDARIALGRAGISLPTAAHLDFQLAHARARDAVHTALDVPGLRAALADVDLLTLHSAAPDRNAYLQRPDLGRRLDDASRDLLGAPGNGKSGAPATSSTPADRSATARRYDLAMVLADGLSPLAIAQNAAPFLAAFYPRVAAENWSVAPLCVVEQGRVAIGDEIGELLAARLVVVLIGERPGLSAPDSMGLYLTWMPRVGLTDAQRNCISNVRPAGLGYRQAAHKLHYLLSQAMQRGLSGVALKDDAVAAAMENTDTATAANTGAPRHGERNFLLG